MRTDTYCSGTLSLCVHTELDNSKQNSVIVCDPDSLPSFAEECSFGNWLSDSYH